MQMLTSAPPIQTAAVKHKTLICIPAFNEESNIGKVLDLILSDKNGNRIFDVLVVDDGSSDKTREVCKRRKVTVISHIYNMGYGAALKTAYKYAVDKGYDYIIQIDADGQHDISNIGQIYECMTDASSPFNNYQPTLPDIVIGSRFLHGSVTFHIPFYKKFVIAFFNIIIRLVTHNKITDPTSGLQGLNRSVFSFYAEFERFALDYPDANMIIQMAFNDFIVREIPASMHPRHNGVSMHSGIFKPIKYVLEMVLSVLVVCIRESLQRNKRKKNINLKTNQCL